MLQRFPSNTACFFLNYKSILLIVGNVNIILLKFRKTLWLYLHVYVCDALLISWNPCEKCSKRHMLRTLTSYYYFNPFNNVWSIYTCALEFCANTSISLLHHFFEGKCQRNVMFGMWVTATNNVTSKHDAVFQFPSLSRFMVLRLHTAQNGP